jgi:hypothetical protein
MGIEVGQRLNLRIKGRSVVAEIVNAELLNPGDRHSYSKRDSNPIYKITARVPEMNILLVQQIEMTDSIIDNTNGCLEEAFSSALARGEGRTAGK